MKPPTTRALTPARIVALVLIGLTIAGLAYLRFAPDDRVSVPKGAQAGDLVLEPCTYATEDGSYAADCGTLVVPENRADPQSRLIALPVTRIRARSRSIRRSRSSASRAAPASRTCSSRRRAATPPTATSSSSATAASTAPSGSTAPRSSRRMKHSTDFLGEKSFRAYERRLPCVREAAHRRRRRPRPLRPRAAGRRPRGRAQGARLRPHRPPERERRDAHGADLRLALPAAHPPLGDDRRRTRPGTSSGTRQTTDEQLGRYAGPLREGRELPQADRRPRRLDAADGREHARPLALPADPGEHRADLHVLRAHGVDVGDGAAERADDDRLVALGGRGRRERALAPVARRRSSLPEAVRLGPVRLGREAGRPGGEGVLRLRHAERRLEPRLCRDGVRLGRRPPGRRLAGRPGRERVQPHADVEGGDPPDRRGARLLDAAAGRDARSSCRTCRTATRSCFRDSGTRARSGRDQPEAGTQLDQHVPRRAARSTPRSTSRSRSTSRRRSRCRRSRRASRPRWSAWRS